MKQNMKRGLFLATVASVVVLGVLPFGLSHPGSSTLPGIQAPLADKPGPPGTRFGQVPLQFIPNEGQDGPGIDFYIQGRDKIVSFSEEGLTFVLDGHGTVPWAVKIGFLGSRPGVKPAGTDRSGAVVSYLKGPREEQRSGLPAYSKIAYRDLWPGIDLVCSGSNDRLKYEFVVRPGADPSQVGLICRGASDIRVTPAGRLEIITPAGSFQDDIPVAYQEAEGKRTDVPAAYLLEEAGTVHFRLAEYDRRRTLVIDPAILVSCGFVGGSGADKAHAIATDPQGNVYIAGETSSLDLAFPLGAGPNPAYGGGASDAFVAKIDAEGTGLVYCCYIGGSGADRASGVAVDRDGNVYVAGRTSSPETSFPVTLGPDLTYNGGDSDGFVAKLNPDGASLAFCGYLGGEGTDDIRALALCSSDYAETYALRVYVAGSTSSSEETFPAAVGPDLTYNGGESDAFVAQLKNGGTGLEFCGYIGGAGEDAATGLASVVFCVEFGASYESVSVAGYTSSTESTFPVALGPDLTYNGGEYDAFVAVLGWDHAGLASCGYIGGAGLDVASGLITGMFPVPGSSGNFYMGPCVTGYTSSTESTFPVAVGPGLTFNGGDSDAFVAMIANDPWPGGPPTVLACGYIGGTGSDAGAGIVLNGETICIAGTTSSSEATFPVAYSADMTYNGGASDVFVAKLKPDMTALTSSGYVGGSGEDRAEALAVSEGKDIYIVGTTDSGQATFPALGGPDLAYNGGVSDAFVARLRMKGPMARSLSRSSANQGEPGFILTVTGSDFIDGARTRWSGKDLATTFINDTELRAAVEAEDLASGGYIPVTVENPDSEASAALTFEVRRPAPTLTSLSPARALAGSSGLTLTLSGTGFVSMGDGSWPPGPSLGNNVLWNGNVKGTIFISPTELLVEIPGSDLTGGGEIPVKVITPPPSLGDSNAVVFSISTFSMAASPASMTINAGQSANYAIQLAPQFGPFDAPVSFVCAGLPAKCAASFSPEIITPGGDVVSTTLTLRTTAPSVAAARALGMAGPKAAGSGLLLLIVLGSAFLRLYGGHPVGRYRRYRWLAGAAVVLLALSLSTCSADKIPGTPPGTYHVEVKATSGGLTVSSEVTLVVK